LFNISLIIVSLHPNAVNFIRDMLALKTSQRGRVIALLIITSIFLFLYSIYTNSKLDRYQQQFDRLIRSLGANTLDLSAAVIEKIKPIMIVMPAFNEARNLKEILSLLPTHIGSLEIGILVIDDGSIDDTPRVATEAGACLVRNPINRGGGAALRLGYDILQKTGSQICVTMDADGQHDPGEIEKILLPIVNDQYDFVIGSRIIGEREKDSRLRIAGVYLFGWLISFMLGKKITDPSSGFRAFRMESVASINLREDQYHTSELIIEAVKKGLRIGEAPITILKRKHGKSKKGNDWAYGLHFARIIFKTWWR
jgi:glycosyltransferase involved in cell wall biosynthesis